MLNSSNMAGFFTKSISQIIGSSYYNKTPEVGSQYILGTSPPDGSMELYILDNKLQVCSCPREKIPLLCHSIIRMALLPDSSPSFFSLTEAENMTLILTEEDFKELPENVELETSGQVWRVLTVSVGALGSFNEIMGVSKIAKSAIGPLADNNVSVLCLSTYQSDYILVQESQLDEAIQCLSSYFKIFNEDHKRVIESKTTAPLSPTPKKSRPIIHPYQSPEKIFHVAGLDASKLSGVVQVLLELMFFPKNTADEFSFFHFTIVHGDISLVLDEDSFNKFPKNTLYSSQSSKDGNWKIISIGEQPLGFVECGIVAQVVEPLASSQVSSYYLSTYDIEYCMVHETDYQKAKDTFESLKFENFSKEESLTEIDKTDGPDGKEDTETTETTTEINADIRPGENMSLSESLDNIQQAYPSTLHEANYSRSPLTPTSECSSYGTSPLSDVDLTSAASTTTNASSVTTDPIPIPSTSLRESITRLKC